MAKYRKDGTLYLFLAFLVMGLLFGVHPGHMNSNLK